MVLSAIKRTSQNSLSTGKDGDDDSHKTVHADTQYLSETYKAIMKEESSRSVFASDYICIIDSLKRPLLDSEWNVVKECVFVFIFHWVLLHLNTTPTTDERNTISDAELGTKVRHACLASFHAVDVVLWHRRAHIYGPQQPNNRSCGAYGIATIWNLCIPKNLSAFRKWMHLNSGSSKKRTRKGTSRMQSLTHHSLYGEDMVENVFQLLDRMIRSEVFSLRKKGPITKLD